MYIAVLHGIGGYGGIHWQQWLHDQLTRDGHIVRMPTLSNAEHPDRTTWQKEVEKTIAGIDTEQLVIVAHSLGVPTALDVVERLPHKLRGLVCVSGFGRPYGADLNDYFMKERSIDFANVRNKIHTAIVFYGDDDPYVSQEALHSLAVELGVEPRVIANGGHLNTEAGYTTFPELLAAVRSL